MYAKDAASLSTYNAPVTTGLLSAATRRPPTR